jgi:hypothetical protein
MGSRTSQHNAETAAAQGMVRIQAVTMLPATPQRTAEIRRVAPTPMIEVLITCVVEIGRPSCAVVSSTLLATVCAAKPLTGVSV